MLLRDLDLWSVLVSTTLAWSEYVTPWAMSVRLLDEIRCCSSLCCQSMWNFPRCHCPRHTHKHSVVSSQHKARIQSGNRKHCFDVDRLCLWLFRVICSISCLSGGIVAVALPYVQLRATHYVDRRHLFWTFSICEALSFMTFWFIDTEFSLLIL